MGNKFGYDGVPGTHQWYDGTPHPWEFKRVWHLEPSLTDPDTVYAGVEDAALFRSTDGGQTGRSSPACAATAPGRAGSRAPAACACTRSSSTRATRSRIFIAISAAGAFRTDDGGADLAADQPRPAVRSTFPIPDAEVGHCVHRIAMHPSRPDVLFMQKHWDVMRSDDAGDSWHEVSGNLPTDFGFAIDVHAHEPETDLRGPDQERLRALPARGQAARLPQPHRRQRVGAAHQGPAARATAT